MDKITKYIQPFLFAILFFILILAFYFPEVNSYLDINLNPINKNIENLTSVYIRLLPNDIKNSTYNLYNGLATSETLQTILAFLLPVNFAAAILICAKGLFDTVGALLNLSKSPSLTARIFFPLIGLLGIDRKAKPWGIVYDADTKQPIDPAVVTISTRENGVGEFTQTRITDIQGRFTFLIAPGHYILKALKTNYVFPSKIVKGQTDGKFQNVYHGEIIEVTNPDIINLNIPMDPMSFDWNQSIKPKNKNVILNFAKEKGRLILIITGTLTSALSYILSPLALNLAPLLIFPLNLAFVKTNIQRKMWGIVFNQKTKEPVPRVEVKAINIAVNLTLAHTATDHLGRYFLLLSQGTYTLKVEAPASAGEPPTILAQIDNVVVSRKKQIINFDIGV